MEDQSLMETISEAPGPGGHEGWFLEGRPYGCEEKSCDAAFRTHIAPSTHRLVLNLQRIDSL